MQKYASFLNKEIMKKIIKSYWTLFFSVPISVAMVPIINQFFYVGGIAAMNKAYPRLFTVELEAMAICSLVFILITLFFIWLDQILNNRA